MKLIREILLDAAREIVEGRVKLPTVRTVPWRERVLKPKAMEETPSFAAPAARPLSERTQVKKDTGHAVLAELMAAYEATFPGDFTCHDFSDYARTQGFVRQIQTFRNVLKAANGAGRIVCAGTVPTWRHNAAVIYRFAAEPQ